MGVVVQEDEWGRIRRRMESTWPIPELSEARWDEYRHELNDLDEATTNLALDQLLTEGATVMPPPRLLRARARRGAPEFASPESEEQLRWGAPPLPPSPEGPPVSAATPRSSGRATAALVLGIVGLLAVPLICSVLAIVFGATALSRIAENPGMSGRGSALWGLWLGIFGLAAWAALVVMLAVADGMGDQSQGLLLTL